MRQGPTWGEAPFIPASPAVLELRFRRFVLNQTEETVIRGLGLTQDELQLFHLLPLSNLERDSEISTSLNKKTQKKTQQQVCETTRVVIVNADARCALHGVMCWNLKRNFKSSSN